MPAQFWESLLNTNGSAGSAGIAYNTSVTRTDVSVGAQTAPLVLPANFLSVGSSLRLTAAGIFSNTLTPTLALGFYYGGAAAGVKLVESPVVTTTTAAVNWHWRMEYTGVVRTTGTAGTIIGSGVLYLATSLSLYTVIPLDAAAMTTATIDTTLAKSLTTTAIWGTNAAANTLTQQYFLVESMA